MEYEHAAGGTSRKRKLPEDDAKKIKDNAINQHNRRRSSRVVRQPSLAAFGAVRNFIGGDPKYESATDHPHAGGRKSSVILGPILWGGASDADSDLPAAINKVRKIYENKEVFYAGHILNAELGGNGKVSKNLTILTAAANSSHKTFESGVRKAVELLHKAYSALRQARAQTSDFESWGYGIRVEVEVDRNDTWGKDYPLKCVTKKLTCTAEVVGDEGPKEFLRVMVEKDPSTGRISDEIADLMNAVEEAVNEVNGFVVDNLPSSEASGSGQTDGSKRPRDKSEQVAGTKGKSGAGRSDEEEEEEEYEEEKEEADRKGKGRAKRTDAEEEGD